MERVYYKQLIEGAAIPAIIHNSSYFLIQMAVYENGTVSCWHKSDLQQFWSDLEKGWVVPSVPPDAELSINNLGCFPIREARWFYNREEYYHRVEEVVRSLNPEMTNLYRMAQWEKDKWEKARVRWKADPTPCKLKPGWCYTLIDGDSSYIFYRQEGRLHLTSLTVYADKTVRLGAVSDRSYTLEEIEGLFVQKILSTSPEGVEWVEIDGLGNVLLAPPEYGALPVEEKRKEINDTMAGLSGEKDSLDRCKRAHYQYLTDPNDWTREELRKAYEAVPEHQRMFLGDMDTRDNDFIRILYSPEVKREV